jgi:hypothetical protein
MGFVAPFIEEVRTHWVTSVNFTGYKPVPETSDLSRHKSDLLWRKSEPAGVGYLGLCPRTIVIPD